MPALKFFGSQEQNAPAKIVEKPTLNGTDNDIFSRKLINVIKKTASRKTVVEMGHFKTAL